MRKMGAHVRKKRTSLGHRKPGTAPCWWDLHRFVALEGGGARIEKL